MKDEKLAVLCITAIVGLSIWLTPNMAEQITIAGLSGLIGYLSKGS